MLVDVHAHLTIGQFDKDIDEVMKRNKDVTIIENGLDYENNLKVLELAGKYKNVRAALGLYPTHAVEINDENFANVLKFIKKNKSKTCAVGEIGLDLQEIEDIKLQRERFIELVELARKIDKPVIVHSRKAEKETVEALESTGYKKVVMHCFCGNMKLVKRIEDNGWFITIPVIVLNSQQFQLIAERVSINQILTETDSPYLHFNKNERNEPRNVSYSLKKISEIKNMDEDEVKKNIFMNFQKLFKK